MEQVGVVLAREARQVALRPARVGGERLRTLPRPPPAGGRRPRWRPRRPRRPPPQRRDQAPQVGRGARRPPARERGVDQDAHAYSRPRRRRIVTSGEARRLQDRAQRPAREEPPVVGARSRRAVRVSSGPCAGWWRAGGRRRRARGAPRAAEPHDVGGVLEHLAGPHEVEGAVLHGQRPVLLRQPELGLRDALPRPFDRPPRHVDAHHPGPDATSSAANAPSPHPRSSTRARGGTAASRNRRRCANASGSASAGTASHTPRGTRTPREPNPPRASLRTSIWSCHRPTIGTFADARRTLPTVRRLLAVCAVSHPGRRRDRAPPAHQAPDDHHVTVTTPDRVPSPMPYTPWERAPRN